jgi:hypothetical protein
MKLIDWYIVRKFITTFFFCLIALTILVVIVDLSEKTDDFAKTGLTAKQIIVQYYFGFLPRIDAMLFPLFLFISVIFFYFKNGESFRDHCHPEYRNQFWPFPASLYDYGIIVYGFFVVDKSICPSSGK